MVQILAEYGANIFETMVDKSVRQFQGLLKHLLLLERCHKVSAECTNRKSFHGDLHLQAKNIKGCRELSAFEFHLSRNPKVAAEFLEVGVFTNGQDIDSSDLLIIMDLELFMRESLLGEFQAFTTHTSL